MRIDRGLLRWGVFLIVLGSVPLAVRAGYLDTDTVRRAWELWVIDDCGCVVGRYCCDDSDMSNCRFESCC